MEKSEKSEKRKKTAKRVILSVLALVVVAVIACGMYLVTKYTKWFTTSFQTFSVRYDGQTYLADNNSMLLQCNEEGAKFEVEYLVNRLPTTKDKLKGYTVAILPYITEEDFDVIYSGGVIKYSDAASLIYSGNLNKAFNISYKDDYFVIQADKALTVAEVLSAALGEKVTTANAPKDTTDVYELVVYNNDRTASVHISFHYNVKIGGITPTPGEIIF